jgi:hypothetical protein
MAQFIHLTDERLVRQIAKVGIKPNRHWNTESKCVFAMPVLQDFMVSHQWLRELKRWGVRTIAAVQFRLPDEEPVRVGHYGRDSMATTAVGVFQIFKQHRSGLGLEVMIPRRIEPDEFMRIYVPTQLVGWRFSPEAKGRKPCGCPYCARGEINSRVRREAYQERNRPGYFDDAK